MSSVAISSVARLWMLVASATWTPVTACGRVVPVWEGPVTLSRCLIGTPVPSNRATTVSSPKMVASSGRSRPSSRTPTVCGEAP